MINYLGNQPCSCGKIHTASIDEVVVGNGILCRLPEFVNKYEAKRPFVLADINTFQAAGEAVCNILKESGIAYSQRERQACCDWRDSGCSGACLF